MPGTKYSSGAAKYTGNQRRPRATWEMLIVQLEIVMLLGTPSVPADTSMPTLSCREDAIEPSIKRWIEPSQTLDRTFDRRQSRPRRAAQVYGYACAYVCMCASITHRLLTCYRAEVVHGENRRRLRSAHPNQSASGSASLRLRHPYAERYRACAEARRRHRMFYPIFPGTLCSARGWHRMFYRVF